jgi:hypothetical protein
MMARKRKPVDPEYERRFEENTKMINDYLEKLRRRIAERKAREAEAHQS